MTAGPVVTIIGFTIGRVASKHSNSLTVSGKTVTAGRNKRKDDTNLTPAVSQSNSLKDLVSDLEKQFQETVFLPTDRSDVVVRSGSEHVPVPFIQSHDQEEQPPVSDNMNHVKNNIIDSKLDTEEQMDTREGESRLCLTPFFTHCCTSDSTTAVAAVTPATNGVDGDEKMVNGDVTETGIVEDMDADGEQSFQYVM